MDWEGKPELAIFVLKFPYGWLFPYDLIMLIYNFRIEISIRMVISIQIDITGRSST